MSYLMLVTFDFLMNSQLLFRFLFKVCDIIMSVCCVLGVFAPFFHLLVDTFDVSILDIGFD